MPIKKIPYNAPTWARIKDFAEQLGLYYNINITCKRNKFLFFESGVIIANGEQDDIDKFYIHFGLCINSYNRQ